jgi:uncharacterized protein HemX
MPPVFAQAVGFTADANTILALCALVTAVGAGLVFVWKGGSLTQQLETAIQAIADLSKELKESNEAHELAIRESNQSHNEAINGLTRMVYEMRGSMRAERSGPSRPPTMSDE